MPYISVLQWGCIQFRSPFTHLSCTPQPLHPCIPRPLAPPSLPSLTMYPPSVPPRPPRTPRLQPPNHTPKPVSPSHLPPNTHLLCARLLHELDEGKAHGTVGVATDATVHHCAAVSKEGGQALLSHLQDTSMQDSTSCISVVLLPWSGGIWSPC
jgi:hypothetical protein